MHSVCAFSGTIHDCAGYQGRCCLTCEKAGCMYTCRVHVVPSRVAVHHHDMALRPHSQHDLSGGLQMKWGFNFFTLDS